MAKLEIPEGTRKMFPEECELIENSKSTTLEEKKYWIRNLPYMLEKQVSELREILLFEAKECKRLNIS